MPLQVNVGSGTGYVRTSSIKCCHSPSLMFPGANTIVRTGEDLPEIDKSLQTTLSQVEGAVAQRPPDVVSTAITTKTQGKPPMDRHKQDAEVEDHRGVKEAELDFIMNTLL